MRTLLREGLMPGLGSTRQLLSAPFCLHPSTPSGIVRGQFLIWKQTLWTRLGSNSALCSLPTAWSSVSVRDQDEGKKGQDAHQPTQDPQLLFLHPNLASRAGLKPKAETGQLIIVQLGGLQAEILEAKPCGKKGLWASGGLGPSYWPSSVPQTPLPGCLAAS